MLTPDLLQIERIDCFIGFEQFEAALNKPGSLVAGFDFPFSLPRIFVEQVGWPLHREDMVACLAEMGREAFESTIQKLLCRKRAEGSKHPRRATDVAANSRSPLMLDYTPVGKMFFEGAWRLSKAGLCVAPCRINKDDRIAVEAYPALVARRWVPRPSYKSDSKRKQTVNQVEQRRTIVKGLRGNLARDAYGFGISASDQIWDKCTSEPGADLLDALMCCVQAGWAHSKRGNGYGIPFDADPLEGWILDPTTARSVNSRSARSGG